MLLSNKIKVGARASNLSKVQVQEVYEELKNKVPLIDFDVIYLDTKGDRDKKTSLRELEKSNFFTDELDNKLLQRAIRVSINSAKDLPDPLPDGLTIAAITRGLSASDSLVFNKLPIKPKIGTSSLRRQECLKQVFKEFETVDIRGTIEDRLELLNKGVIDGLIVAECALIRLKLTHLNRQILPIQTAHLQGKLAVVACLDDQEMLDLFSHIDERHLFGQVQAE
jgi:hydroxymethylbilane synthase